RARSLPRHSPPHSHFFGDPPAPASTAPPNPDFSRASTSPARQFCSFPLSKLASAPRPAILPWQGRPRPWVCRSVSLRLSFPTAGAPHALQPHLPHPPHPPSLPPFPHRHRLALPRLPPRQQTH